MKFLLHKSNIFKFKEKEWKLLILLGVLFIFISIPLTVQLTSQQRDFRSKAAVQNTIPVAGGNYFLLGANYPWISYGNDFGSNNWGAFGVHARADYDQDFADMKAKGVHVIRWYVLVDGRGGVIFDSGGTPTGLDQYVFQDLDAAVALAKKHNIYLNLVLLDFSWVFTRADLGSGVIRGGHNDTFSNATKRDALINNVIDPIISRYPNEPYILSWEAMNEPEWVISDIPQPAVDSNAVPVTMVQFWNYASRVSNLVHTKTTSKFTIGSATLKWNKIWTNSFAQSRGLPLLNLDYYQTHYYPWMDCCTTNDPVLGNTTWSPLTQTVSALNLDKPIVVGEFPETFGSSQNAINRDKIFNNGYAGYWPWSYWGGDGIPVDWTGYSAWESSKASIVRIPPSGGTSTPKPGDLTNDGKVNVLDLIFVTGRWLTSDPTADLNDDNLVNILDLIYITSRWAP